MPGLWDWIPGESVGPFRFDEPASDLIELYDLVKDPGEKDNLYGKPGTEELTKQLKARLAELRKETGDGGE